MAKPKTFGTKEWASHNANCCRGCSNNCWYCYARAMAARFKRCAPDHWTEMETDLSGIHALERMRYPTRIMFPSSHDILPEILDECVETIFRLLRVGHAVLIVSKPRLECIERILQTFPDYRKQILFRFSIGSCDDEALRLWEPSAPDFTERLASLKLAYKNHFATSVSCEPILDRNTLELLSSVGPWVSTTFWIGRANYLQSRPRPGERSLCQLYPLPLWCAPQS